MLQKETNHKKYFINIILQSQSQINMKRCSNCWQISEKQHIKSDEIFNDIGSIKEESFEIPYILKQTCAKPFKK